MAAGVRFELTDDLRRQRFSRPPRSTAPAPRRWRRTVAERLQDRRVPADRSAMNCPACGHALTSRTAGAVAVDVCDGGCGGIWFDHYELKKLDEPSESAGESLLDVKRDPADVVDPAKRYTCPKCTDGVVMMRHFWSVKRAVTMDECPECGGVFLDAGELGSIRHEFPTEEAKHAAADAYFAEVVDPMLKEQHELDRAELARAQKFASAFRFICPSTYIPGKQEGAAF